MKTIHRLLLGFAALSLCANLYPQQAVYPPTHTKVVNGDKEPVPVTVSNEALVVRTKDDEPLKVDFKKGTLLALAAQAYEYKVVFVTTGSGGPINAKHIQDALDAGSKGGWRYVDMTANYFANSNQMRECHLIFERTLANP